MGVGVVATPINNPIPSGCFRAVPKPAVLFAFYVDVFPESL
jgi:hypothetical protein